MTCLDDGVRLVLSVFGGPQVTAVRSP